MSDIVASNPVESHRRGAEPSKCCLLKESSDIKTETDSSGELSSCSWGVDNSGFLSPAGSGLKEVLDMVEGVSLVWFNLPTPVCTIDVNMLGVVFTCCLTGKTYPSFSGPGRLVQSRSLWPSWGKSQPWAPPVSSRGKCFAGVEQRQQRGTHPHFFGRVDPAFHTDPSKPEMYCPISWR